MIDLTTSDLETDEENDYNNEDDDDNFINNEEDDDEEESDESNDDDEPDINGFIIEMKVDPAYSPRGRALSEWDPNYWRGF